jgi:bifunctional non-homologous end joining protein LigD
LGSSVEELAALKVHSAIIDSEAVVLNEAGVADFQALQREVRKEARAHIVLMAFDLLHHNGVDVRKRPLLERKALLRDSLGKWSKSSLLRYNDHMSGDGKAVLANACKLGLEGIISKRIDRPYRSGRSSNWLKSKCLLSDPFIVIGFTLQAGSKLIGSLVLGYHDGASLIYAGRVGTGFSEEEAHAMQQALQMTRTEHPPTTQRVSHVQRQGVIWVQPRLVAKVQYRGWSSDPSAALLLQGLPSEQAANRGEETDIIGALAHWCVAVNSGGYAASRQLNGAFASTVRTLTHRPR